MDGTNGTIFALGDCTATTYAPTAQVASQQGAYLARNLAQIAKRDAVEARLAALKHSVGEAAASPEAGAEKEKEIRKMREAIALKQREQNLRKQAAVSGNHCVRRSAAHA